MADAKDTYMMTAIMIYLGLSACATMAIVAAVVVGARRGMVHGTASAEAQRAGSTVKGMAYSH
jgi:hypothetical protein